MTDRTRKTTLKISVLRGTMILARSRAMGRPASNRGILDPPRPTRGANDDTMTGQEDPT